MKILILNGPNLNNIHKRDHLYYGNLTLDQINENIKKTYPDIEFVFKQTNHEGEIIDILQDFVGNGIIINPGGYTHTSIAIRDALEYINILKVEVHLSDIYHRESFRKINYISDVVNLSIIGHKEKGYYEAIDYIIETLKEVREEQND